MIPISGKVCKPCVRQFEDKFGKKQGEKIVIVMKSGNAAAAVNMAANTLAMPSPFVKQEPGVSPAIPPPPPPPPLPPPPPPLTETSTASTQRQRLTRLTTGALAAQATSGLKREAPDVDGEVTSRGASGGEPLQGRRRRRHNLTEADLEDDESDDDRTWRPNRDEGASSDEEEEDDPPEKENEGEEEEDEDEDDPANNAISDGSSADLHYYCRICQITFYKHTSYKQHMRNSKKIHKELQKKDKEDDEEYECSDCCIAFKDKTAQLKHLATVHKSSPKGSFFCTICSVSLRSGA